MTIAFFVLVIEKVEGNYHAYSPSFAGVSASGSSREEVERSALDQMNSHVEELNRRHATGSQRLELSTKPIQEKITCLEVLGHSGRLETCKSRASVEGLCWQHWRRRYGHHASTSLSGYRTCQLCGERDPDALTKLDQRCEFKTTHSDWPSVLITKRQEALEAKRIARQEDSRQRMIASLPVQCTAIRTQGPKGVQCANKAQRDGLCTGHWKLQFGEPPKVSS